MLNIHVQTINMWMLICCGSSTYILLKINDTNNAVFLNISVRPIWQYSTLSSEKTWKNEHQVEIHFMESQYMGVSKNKGTPKWMVYIMEHLTKMDDLGVPLFSETSIYHCIHSIFLISLIIHSSLDHLGFHENRQIAVCPTVLSIPIG